MRYTNQSWEVKEGLNEAENAVGADDDILRAKEAGSWRCFIFSSSRPHSPLFIIYDNHDDKTIHLDTLLALLQRPIANCKDD